MDVRTARRNLAAAERAMKAAREHFNSLADSSARRRRADPALPKAKADMRAAEAKMRQAVDDYRKAQERPRYTAPR